ncbi:MAG: aldo/keto reductase, partial [Candidatus Aminicenantes bacterium]|nr:aldo/keto reductase [Candidatus Aminicenantes bacterium]
MVKNNSRRDFLKKGLTGITAAAIAPSLIKSEGKKKTEEKTIYRTLGKTGMKVPIVSMGVMNAENPKLVEAALENGMNYLDTAHVYQRGKNEEMLGEVLKGVKRDSYFLATKVPGNHADRKTGLYTDKTDPADFLKKFEISLKRLKLDYVDVLFLHSVKRKESVMFEPLMSLMQKLKKEGKTKFIGVSTHRNEPEVIRAAADSNVYDIVLTAYNFMQSNLAEMDKAINYAAGKGIGIVAMKTQAGVYWDKEKLNPINMKAALKWSLQNQNVHTSIPGFTTFDQLNTDLEVMSDLNMTGQEMLDLKLNEKV